MTTLLSAQQLHKSYRKGPVTVPVLRGVDFAVGAGEFLSIIGQSGSGKSTLLHLLATLDRPDKGQITFDGQRIDKLPSRQRDQLRNQQFGMIFQFYHLLPELTTLENVMIPRMIRHGILGYWKNRRELRRRAQDLLSLVGMSHRLKHRPRELSGGEMQRVAIARSLLASPRVLFADEPTGNLDAQTGAEVMELLRSLNVQQGLTIVMVTHDQEIAAQADRIVQLTAGKVAAAA
ncbi:MAG: ABC transporter ATP-binding protein [Planctomycetales bacterium]|nr:ABC transporter ATP-binding protein [Planctomycetales bacterium]